jgi:hypothetical protein
MAKIKITETNGASAEDISDAIGKFLEQQGKKEAEEAPKTDKK